MSRYYVCSKVNTVDIEGALVCDKNDGIVEFLDRSKLLDCINMGLDIDGVNKDGKVIYCRVDKDKLDWLKKYAIKKILAGFGVGTRTCLCSFSINIPDTVNVECIDDAGYIVNFTYNIDLTIDSCSNPMLCLSCSSINNCGYSSSYDDILVSELDSFPLVIELLWIFLNRFDNLDLKKLLIGYFGGVENIIELTIMSGLYYLDCMKGDYHNTLGIFNNGCLREEMYHL